MRILYHHRTQAEDGQAVHVRALLEAFEAEGHVVHEVGLVRHHAREGEGERAASRNGRARWSWVTRLPRFLRELAEYGYSGIARRRVVGAAARFRPDFLYERYAFGNAAGVLAARRLRLPLVLEVNSPMVLELQRTRGLSFPGLARKLESFVFGAADRVCAVTGVLGEMLIELGVPRERLFVTPNGVHLERYDYPDRDRTRHAARRDLGLAPPDEPDEMKPAERKEGEITFGFVGYYRAWHRLDLALEALGRSELARARLVLIGAGPAREGLERRAVALGVRDRVVFAGARPHDRIPALLPAFDVALIPAINPYASPLKLHEYMAAELAVIAPDQPNLREVLEAGVNASLFAAHDGEALGAAMVALAGDAELRRALGAAARATVVERDLTWGGNARRVVAAVEGLLA
ncbi:MAG: glycosyltransferase [Planctomycetota bacterium]|nr:glycosyltransferase [Planctomycetota bacterium]